SPLTLFLVYLRSYILSQVYRFLASLCFVSIDSYRHICEISTSPFISLYNIY
ncbi:hypothetical protein CSUI_008195, partial [Cystoisospora suis]